LNRLFDNQPCRRNAPYPTAYLPAGWIARAVKNQRQTQDRRSFMAKTYNRE
jgi:hypothetical protein